MLNHLSAQHGLSFHFRTAAFHNRAAHSLAGINILCYNKISATGRIRLFSVHVKAFFFLILMILKDDRLLLQLALSLRWRPTFFIFDQKSVWINKESGQWGESLKSYSFPSLAEGGGEFGKHQSGCCLQLLQISLSLLEQQSSSSVSDSLGNHPKALPN